MPTPAFRRLAVAATVAALVLVAVGGAVRATDSGLACPDWPRCYGRWVPPADLNIWIEHTHRLLAGALGLLVLALALGAVARHRARRDILWPALAALLLVTVQAGLGALVVLRLLRAELVTAHLGMAMAVVACLLYLMVNSALARPARAERHRRDRRFGRAAAAVAGLTYVQILVGGHVTGIGAGLAFDLDGFPLMAGAVFPPVTSAQEGYHLAHRFLAVAVAVAVVWLCAHALRHRSALTAAGLWTRRHRWLVTLPLWAAALVVVQILLGIANLANELSFVTVIPHLAVASWIWSLLVLCAILGHRLAPVRRATAPPDAAAAPRQAVAAGDVGERT